MTDGVPLWVVQGGRPKEKTKKEGKYGESMQGLQPKPPAKATNGALVQKREYENSEPRTPQDHCLSHFTTRLEVLSDHQTGGVPHRTAAKGEEEPIGEEDLVQLVAEGGKEESKVHDETSDHCG